MINGWTRSLGKKPKPLIPKVVPPNMCISISDSKLTNKAGVSCKEHILQSRKTVITNIRCVTLDNQRLKISIGIVKNSDR